MSARSCHRRNKGWSPLGTGWGWLKVGLVSSLLLPWGSSLRSWAGDWKTPPPMPEPLGTCVRAFQKTQTTRADADHFVIYEYEWADGGAQLSYFGWNHVMSMVPCLPSSPFPVLIQAHPSVPLNQMRRLTVVQILLAHGIADADMRVKIGLPQAEPMAGEEAVLVHDNVLLNLYLNNGAGAYGTGAYGGQFGGATGFGAGLYGGFRGGFGGYRGYGGRGPFGY